MNKEKSINDYIKIAKGDIDIRLLIFVILLPISIYLIYKFELDSEIIVLNIILIISAFDRIYCYLNIKKINEYLLKNDLLDKIGKIDYWNEKYYLLTENYFIIKEKEVKVIPYSHIKNIYKRKELSFGWISDFSEYLTIITNDDEFKILISTNLNVTEEYKDITEYLINKNNNIKILDSKFKLRNIGGHYFKEKK